MSATKSYQCLVCRLKNAVQQPPIRRQFHASSSSQARKRFPSVKASELSEAGYSEYTPREKKLLSLKYTPEQMKVIEAGEKAVSAVDMAQQGRMRTDPMRIKYLDDFATMRPILDRPLTAEDIEQAQQGLQEGRNPATKKRGLEAKLVEEEKEEVDLPMLRLSQQTGLSLDEIKRIRVKNLVSHRVVNQTRMGKIQSIYFLTIAGNEDGMVGIGEGKAAETEDGRRQAMMNAIRNMKPVARHEERTIYGEVEGKVGATIVRLSSRPPGKSLHSLFRARHFICLTIRRLRKSLPVPHLRTRARCGY